MRHRTSGNVSIILIGASGKATFCTLVRTSIRDRQRPMRSTVTNGTRLGTPAHHAKQAHYFEFLTQCYSFRTTFHVA